MKIKKKIFCFLGAIFYFITYFDIDYKTGGEFPKPYIYTYISNEIIDYKIGYVSEKNITIKNIEILKKNILGYETVIFDSSKNKVKQKDSFEIFITPFWTKEIIFKSEIFDQTESLNSVLRVYKPNFEFGIFPFWSFIPIFEYAKPVVIFKFGSD